MIVKHIAADGKIRRTFTDVSSIHQHTGNSMVSVNRQALYTETVGGIPVPDSRQPLDLLRSYQYEYPLALINLAPGESLERTDDEPARG